MSNLTGKVFTGRGEGSYFIGLEGYRQQIIDKLGINPYQGTLNLKVEPEKLALFLENLEPIVIKGFTDRDTNFGEILCYRIKINDIIGYAIIPQKSHYKGDTIEIISEYFLREKFGLYDGDNVIIKRENNEG